MIRARGGRRGAAAGRGGHGVVLRGAGGRVGAARRTPARRRATASRPMCRSRLCGWSTIILGVHVYAINTAPCASPYVRSLRAAGVRRIRTLAPLSSGFIATTLGCLAATMRTKPPKQAPKMRVAQARAFPNHSSLLLRTNSSTRGTVRGLRSVCKLQPIPKRCSRPPSSIAR